MRQEATGDMLFRAVAAGFAYRFHVSAWSRGLLDEARNSEAVAIGLGIVAAACDQAVLLPEDFVVPYVLRRSFGEWRKRMDERGWTALAQTREVRRARVPEVPEHFNRCRWCRRRGSYSAVLRTPEGEQTIYFCSACAWRSDGEHSPGGQRGKDPDSGAWIDDAPGRARLLRDRARRRWGLE